MRHAFWGSLSALALLLGGCSTRGPAPSPSAVTGQPERRESYVEAGGGVRLFARTVGVNPDTVIVLHGGPGRAGAGFSRTQLKKATPTRMTTDRPTAMPKPILR